MMVVKFLTKKLVFVCFGLAVSGLQPVAATGVAAQTGTRQFTVADDIGLNQIGQTVLFSPDGRFFIAASDRGRLDLNRPESSLRLYSTEDVHRLLTEPKVQEEPSPLWTISKSTYRYGPIISNVRWLPDSSGFVFLAKTDLGTAQLFIAKTRAKTIEAITPEGQSVTAFDVHSERQFVYSVESPNIKRKADEFTQATAIVGTGSNLMSLMFPVDSMDLDDLSELWAVLDGQRFRVVNALSGHPVAIHSEGVQALALSPDGRSVVTALTVNTVPAEWELLYPPPIPSSPYRVRAGRQNPDALDGREDVSEYVLVDLASGRIKPLADAPTGNTAGWVGLSFANWASDGQSVVMSNTFLPPVAQPMNTQVRRPCVAVADLSTGNLTCVERRKEQTEQNDQENWRVANVHFIGGSERRLIVRYDSGGSTVYVRSANGVWIVKATADESIPQNHSIDVYVKENLNDPPVLMAVDKQGKISRVIWNPNPQLRDVQLGEVSIFKWKDKTGRDWIGGLYKPPDYVSSKRYPLVFQTHGFDKQEFRPSGAFPTAFAAQELAAVGFLVLQVEDCDISGPEEGPCQVAGYEAAAQELTAEGLADPDRVGIIGFSRTCYYVLQALTTSMLHFKAASITDGINEGYMEYLTQVDRGGNAVAHVSDAMIGASPFGPGLVQWLSHSPDFNMDRVETPLQVVALGRLSVLYMWEPYAVLRYLKKPVDLIVLNSDEHILTNPSARMASQESTVDWFRFWLKGEEVAGPEKARQYARWRQLRK